MALRHGREHGLGLATFRFAIFFTRHHPHRDPTTSLVLPALLTAIADGFLTNQLAVEPEEMAAWLRPGADPVRLLRVRNRVLLLAESLFVALLVLLAVLLTMSLPRTTSVQVRRHADTRGGSRRGGPRGGWSAG
jgi:hypothetical protein